LNCLTPSLRRGADPHLLTIPRADDASDAAEQAKSACDEYEDCRSEGDEDCSAQHDACEEGRATRRSDLEDVQSAIGDIQLSCGHTFQLDSRKALERLKKRSEKQKLSMPPKPAAVPKKVK
jgi:hypothetical protein